jgi:hypothetical protein
MIAESLGVQIKSIESQLSALRAQLRRLRMASPPRSFADLEGMLAGLPDFTVEEIEAALYRSRAARSAFRDARAQTPLPSLAVPVASAGKRPVSMTLQPPRGGRQIG